MVKRVEGYKDRELTKYDVLSYAKESYFLRMDILGQ